MIPSVCRLLTFCAPLLAHHPVTSAVAPILSVTEQHRSGVTNLLHQHNVVPCILGQADAGFCVPHVW